MVGEVKIEVGATMKIKVKAEVFTAFVTQRAEELILKKGDRAEVFIKTTKVMVIEP